MSNMTPAVYQSPWKFGSIERIQSVIDLLPTYVDLADRIAYTEFVPGPLRGNPPAVLAALMAGAERGLGPMESLRSINVIDGRPTLSAEVMRALVLSAGHEIWIVETTDLVAALRGRRRGTEEWSPPFTWTIDRARRAELTGKTNWKRYPEAMLLARCSTDLCRAVFPDIVAGLSSTEEWGDVVETTGRETDHPPLASALPESVPAELDPAAEPEDAPHDMGLARRLHAEISTTFPGASAASKDRIRHALVAIVTRKRAGGPIVSSAGLTHGEQMSLSDRIVDIRRGRASVVDWLDIDGRGDVEVRAAGWTYIVELDPLQVTVARSETDQPAEAPADPQPVDPDLDDPDPDPDPEPTTDGAPE